MDFILILVPLMLLVYLGFRFRSLPLYIRGSRAYAAGETERALDLLLKAVESGLGDNRQLSVGYTLLREGRIEDAERIFNYLGHHAGGKFNAQHARAYNALVLWKRGELDKAVAELEALYDEGYRSRAFYCNLGYFLIEQNRLDRALAINEEALDYDSDSPVIRDNLGLCRIKSEDWDKAEEIYDELLQEEPTFPDAWYNAALVARHSGQGEKAEELLRKALEKRFTYLSTLDRKDVETALADLQNGKG